MIATEELLESPEEAWLHPQAWGPGCLPHPADPSLFRLLHPSHQVPFASPFSVCTGGEITIATIWNESIRLLLPGWHSLVQGSDFKRKQRAEAPIRWREPNFLPTQAASMKGSRRWSHHHYRLRVRKRKRGSNNFLVRKLLDIPEATWKWLKEEKKRTGFFIRNEAISL